MPKIIEAYSPENIRFNENSIIVNIPFDRLGENTQVSPQAGENTPAVGENNPTVGENTPTVGKNNASVGKNNASVEENNASVDGQVNGQVVVKNTQVKKNNTQVEGENTQVDGENTQVEENYEFFPIQNTKAEKVHMRILECCIEPKSMQEITDLLGFKERRTTIKYLKSLLVSGRIQ